MLIFKESGATVTSNLVNRSWIIGKFCFKINTVRYISLLKIETAAPGSILPLAMFTVMS